MQLSAPEENAGQRSLTRATLAAGEAAKVGKNLGASEFGSGSSDTKRAREDDARAGDENADWRAGVLGCVHQSDMAEDDRGSVVVDVVLFEPTSAGLGLVR